MSELIIPGEKKGRELYIHLELLFVVAIWSGTFVSTKIVLTQISPAISALYRYLVASGILFVLTLKNRERIERRDYPSIVLLGLTGVTLYYLLQHVGIQYTTAVDAAILVSLSPVFIGVISWIFLRERLRFASIAGLILALAGSILIISGGNLNFAHGESRIFGNILITLTAVSWAAYSVLGKQLLKKYRTLTLISATTWVGTALLVPFSIFEVSGTQQYTLDWVGWLHMLYLGGAASVYGYLAWYRALARLPSVTVGSYLYFRPLLTGIIAALVIKENIGVTALVGGVIVLLGTYLVQRR
jgi:drug/metabolite transporter (DMT)-like permease